MVSTMPFATLSMTSSKLCAPAGMSASRPGLRLPGDTGLADTVALT